MRPSSREGAQCPGATSGSPRGCPAGASPAPSSRSPCSEARAAKCRPVRHDAVGPHPSIAGDTVVLLAPLGRIQLDTHDAPVRVELRVDELRLADAERFARDPSLLEDVGDDLAADVRAAVRIAGAALPAGGGRRWSRRRAAGPVRWRSRGRRCRRRHARGRRDRWVAGGHLRRRRARRARVQRAAHGRTDGGRRRATHRRALRPLPVQLAELVGNVAALYEAAQGLPESTRRRTIEILHVSDIHLNPQAFDVMRELVDRSTRAAILDTGDITDWGTEPEAQLVDRSRRSGPLRLGAGQPRLDADASGRRRPAQRRRARWRRRRRRRASGVGHRRSPLHAGQGPAGGSPMSSRRRPRRSRPRCGPLRVVGLEDEADVALVHDARAAADLGGKVRPRPLGPHPPRPGGPIGRVTRLLVEGSTGGAGLRGLQQDEPVPLSARCSTSTRRPATSSPTTA